MLPSMALQLPPELEQRVIDLARARGREPNALYAELVANALDDADRVRAYDPCATCGHRLERHGWACQVGGCGCKQYVAAAQPAERRG
jgi:hypothetical protein